MSRIDELAIRLRTAWGDTLQDLAEDERGDVPGWVLITLMSAGADFGQ